MFTDERVRRDVRLISGEVDPISDRHHGLIVPQRVDIRGLTFGADEIRPRMLFDDSVANGSRHQTKGFPQAPGHNAGQSRTSNLHLRAPSR